VSASVVSSLRTFTQILIIRRIGAEDKSKPAPGGVRAVAFWYYQPKDSERGDP
jgi:hypothetical protein